MKINIIWHNKRDYFFSYVLWFFAVRVISRFRVFPFRVSRLESLDTLLIKTDDEWDHCFREAVNFQFPKAFQLFSFIVFLHNPKMHESYTANINCIL